MKEPTREALQAAARILHEAGWHENGLGDDTEKTASTGIPMNQTTADRSATSVQDLAALYEPDETAWLEEMSRRIRTGHRETLDYGNLADYLDDMAKRDRREIQSRLTTLLAHLLKWQFQPAERSRSWKLTVIEQRSELDSAMTKTLRLHAEDVLPKAYRTAVRLAATETGLDEQAFPAECPFTLDQALTEELS